MKKFSFILFFVFCPGAFADEGKPFVLDPTPSWQKADLDKRHEQVQREIADLNKNVWGCYKIELKKDPTAEGKVVVNWTIMPDGHVRDAKILSSTVKSKVFEKCVTDTVALNQFSPTAKGDDELVTYPFNFTKTTKKN